MPSGEALRGQADKLCEYLAGNFGKVRKMHSEGVHWGVAQYTFFHGQPGGRNPI